MGAPVTFRVGAAVGASVGWAVGAAVGASVGSAVGAAVGGSLEAVGANVGGTMRVGSAVGAALGVAVGSWYSKLVVRRTLVPVRLEYKYRWALVKLVGRANDARFDAADGSKAPE